MNILHAIRRCEELTLENARLRKEVESLKEELDAKHKKVGNLISDNGRLVKVNAYLAEQLGKNPRRRRLDDNGDPIPYNPNINKQ